MDSGRFAGVVVRWSWLIILVTVATAAAAYAVSDALPREYESEARVLVGSITDASIDNVNAYQQLAQTYAALATTTPVLSRVAQELEITDGPRQLILDVNARAPLGQSIVRISATRPSATGAQQLADAIAQQLVDLGKPSKDATSLVSVIQPALQPDGPSSPRPLLNALVAGAVGLVVGIGLALLFDRRRSSTRAIDYRGAGGIIEAERSGLRG